MCIPEGPEYPLLSVRAGGTGENMGSYPELIMK